MKKILLIVATILVLAGGAYYLYTLSIQEKDQEQGEVQEEVDLSTTDDVYSKIVGEWVNTDDEKATVTFTEAGNFTHIYNEEVTSSGTWEVILTEGELDASFFIIKYMEDNTYDYEVLNVDKENLSVKYLANNDTANYLRR